jgi:hypothetical protein
MDRRRTPRFPANTPLRLTALIGERLSAAAWLEEVSGSGARVASPVPVAPGTPVQLDLPDAMLLGECVHCQPANGRYSLGVHLEHSLGCLGELRRLMHALVREAPAQARASDVA